MSTFQICIYCACVFVASVIGGCLPGLIRLTHFRMQLMLSFVAGLMIGVSLLHMLPHAAVELGSFDGACVAGLAGLLSMFFMIRTLHTHHHDPPVPASAPLEHEPCGHDHAGHSHSHAEPDEHAHCHVHQHSFVGLFLGLAIHTVIDGLALAAAVRADDHHHGTNGGVLGGLLGVGTFLAILSHKPVDSLSIASVMAAAGWSRSRVQFWNVLFALLCPLGALGFFLGLRGDSPTHHLVIGGALGFAAGVFLCISLADILPEVQFHIHDKLALSAALLVGVAIAYLVGLLEPPHLHASPVPFCEQEVRVE